MSTTPARPGPARRHPTLQQSLLTLVLVPVLGLVSVVGLVVDDRHRATVAAEEAADQVRGAVLLDAVRGSVAQEVLPVLAGSVLLDPTVASSLGLDLSGLSVLAGPVITQQQRTARAATDAAVAATAGTPAADDARDAATRVDALRTGAVDGGDATAVFDGYRDLVADLNGRVGDHLDAARDESLDGPGARAVSDLARAQQASTHASLEVPLYFGSLSVPAAAQADARTAFLQSWAGYGAADTDLRTHGGAAARRAWEQATASGAAGQVDAALDAAALSGATLTLPQFFGLTTANTARDQALRTAVDTIGADAVAATARPAEQASDDLRNLLVAALALLLVSGTVVAVVHRSIASPLRRLARQAEAVRDGELVDVAEGGPREVRTVARGLAATVASLRRVRAQAQAVADGDLTSDVVAQPLAGSLGAVVHASITQMISAIHERERLQVSLAHQASHDALTELPNRAQTTVLVERAMHRARRNDQAVGLLFVDLDHFKAVNDTLGHGAGDELLRVVSARMEATVRGGDTVCRLGGDEFVVLVEPAQDHRQLVDLGRRLIDAVSLPVEIGDRTARVGASVGVALSAPGTTPERLMQDADAAVYRAKAGGRGIVEVFDDDLRRELAEQAAIEEALRQALLEGELVLHYQPVLDLLSGRTTGVEALVRWNRPGHGLVPPNDFIPAAERSDLVCDIGRWALDAALRQLLAWDSSGAGDEGGEGAAAELAGLGMAVNISGRHLATRHLLEDVTDALVATGVDPGRLTLEITETVLVDEPSALGQLEALRALGVKIAIDDFGTGYTSIGQLPKLPVDILKIDRSFVSTPGAGHEDLVRLVISAAHCFDLGVVAEGVEQGAQLDRLIAASCDSVQGFLFARPTAPAELVVPRQIPAAEPVV